MIERIVEIATGTALGLILWESVSPPSAQSGWLLRALFFPLRWAIERRERAAHGRRNEDVAIVKVRP